MSIFVKHLFNIVQDTTCEKLVKSEPCSRSVCN